MLPIKQKNFIRINLSFVTFVEHQLLAENIIYSDLYLRIAEKWRHRISIYSHFLTQNSLSVFLGKTYFHSHTAQAKINIYFSIDIKASTFTTGAAAAYNKHIQ